MITLAPAPDDLIPLISAYTAAIAGTDSAAKIAAHYALYRWRGWKHRPRCYGHGDIAVSRTWDSIKVVRWEEGKWQLV